MPALSAEELTSSVHDNLRNLGLDVLELVNLRSMHGIHGPIEGSIEPQITIMAELHRKGLIKHIGVSNVTPARSSKVRKILPVACVQNHYNLAHRSDDALIDQLNQEGSRLCAVFPARGLSPLQSEALTKVASNFGITPMQTALAWLLARAPNLLAIPGTSSRKHLGENLAAAKVKLTDDALNTLNVTLANVKSRLIPKGPEAMRKSKGATFQRLINSSHGLNPRGLEAYSYPSFNIAG